MTHSEQFDRDLACYEQNCEQMRHLNQIMWQVPLIAMTLTGGLWYAVATVKGVDGLTRSAVLAYSAIANIGLILMINRIRYVFGGYLVKVKEFNPSAFADAEAKSHWFPLMRDRSVVRIFSWLMGTAALISAFGIYCVFAGKWVPCP